MMEGFTRTEIKTSGARIVTLRGGSGPLAAIGRPLVRRVPFPRVEETLDRLMGAWRDGGSGDDEPFRDFCIRTPDDELQAIAAGGVR